MRPARGYRGLLLGVALAATAGGRIARATPSGLRSAPSASLATTTRRSPDEFGVGDYTVTVIPAASFTSDDQYVTDYGSLSRYFPPDDSHHLYYAGLSQVPSGAIIDYVGLECHSGFAGELTVTPFYIDEYSGTTSGIVAVPNTPHDFDTDYNADPIGFQLVRNVHNAIAIVVDQIPNSQPLFGWVEIWWRRDVSPAPPTPTFGDVPASDPGFQYIEALAASGITGGCGGGNFCPDATLTRRQMAVFLAKALGLHWPY
jgi:hypothetical protein